ncbi:beta-beta-alpha zinc fingers domain-containing protein [Dioscorea alata]|uniref:Beta-beta-alpha zinc fingers domain-containing protein n=1 Tax=Dioscorea alata TaxID=55571 RepID=A0ACB7V7Z0_DIOAL|nr:beta-beta-alpha zinc fingers domain-containing protein [Dioscorea alata]
METMEETRSMSSSNDGALLPIIKGKRTKRHRGTPVAAPAGSSASSSEFSGTTTEEEEDMANCLILLAQGGRAEVKPEKFTSRKFTDGKAGFCVYECKTCNKCFPSFQALGGHRASHKKPKLIAPITITTIASPVITADEKKPVKEEETSMNNSFFKPVVPVSRSRVHECSICGSEFNSGQALGGHMRRHRPLDTPEQVVVPEVKRERALLSLDLNLPAPSEDSPAINFPFASKQSIAFSLSAALVDCHY